jgi:AhpD family alkylhydroperoxidase
MQARMNHPAMVVPDAMRTLQALGALTHDGLPEKLLELVHLRASQINGCSACVDMHPKLAKKAGETDERLFSVAAWRDTPYFSEKERAALALTEALTRLSDRADPVPDAIWGEADKQFGEQELAALILAIAIINFWPSPLSTSGTGSMLLCASRLAPGKCDPAAVGSDPSPLPRRRGEAVTAGNYAALASLFPDFRSAAEASCRLPLAC